MPIPLDPLPEMRAALAAHAFGLAGFTVLEAESFPSTEEDHAELEHETRRNHHRHSVRALAELTLLGGEGRVKVRLDVRGYSIENTTSAQRVPHSTFESLDALLIALSPAYVAAMNAALHARLAAGIEQRWVHDEEADEPVWID